MKVNNRTFKLVLSALMVALATVLSLFKIEFLYGGSITIFSMVPLVLVAQMYGTPWGILTGVVYGLIQMVMGIENFGYVTGWDSYVIVALLDYIVAFGVIGLAGCTRKIKNRAVASSLGAIIACVLRFFCHFASGVIVWTKGMEVWKDAPSFLSENMLQKEVVPYTYSLIYNGGFMFPELILTTIGSAILCTIIFEAFKIDVNATKKLKSTAEANLSDVPAAEASAEEAKTEE